MAATTAIPDNARYMALAERPALQAAVVSRRVYLAPHMIRKVGIAGAVFLLVYAVLALVTGQRIAAVGDIGQLIPPIAYGGFTLWLARRSRGQVRMFWNLNAVDAFMWAIGQGVWTYLDLLGGGVPVISPTDPLFFISSIPLAAALYGRPERDRPRWLFDIVLLDLVLIALFSAFIYIYFVVTIAVTDGREDLYNTNLTQPEGNMAAPLFGRSSSALAGRIVQFSGRFTF